MRVASRRCPGAIATFSRFFAGPLHLELFGAPRLHGPASTTVSSSASACSSSSSASSTTRPPSSPVAFGLFFLVYLLLSAAPLFFILYLKYAVVPADFVFRADVFITTVTFTQWLTATGSRASALDILEGAPIQDTHCRYVLLDDGQGYGHFANCGNVMGRFAPASPRPHSLNGYNLQVPPCQVQAEKVPYADHVGGRAPTGHTTNGTDCLSGSRPHRAHQG